MEKELLCVFAVLCCVSIGHIFLLSAAVEEQQWAVRAQPEGSALPSCPGCQAKPGTDSISHLQRRVMRDSMFLPAKLLPAIGGATSPDPSKQQNWQPGQILAPSTHQMLLDCG